MHYEVAEYDDEWRRAGYSHSQCALRVCQKRDDGEPPSQHTGYGYPKEWGPPETSMNYSRLDSQARQTQTQRGRLKRRIWSPSKHQRRRVSGETRNSSLF
ncbi:hypothetical protein X797_004207 [Metarhizium robertsii]|uniref:Uncharacterized protein n=1 Tax=Metarhizium robertsii TaxID=568076 RepID=A0A0A1UYT9_9HYPO|nr:hypothetical protein X797_004207 [Metarhizium robertsii]